MFEDEKEGGHKTSKTKTKTKTAPKPLGLFFGGSRYYSPYAVG